MLAMNPRTPLGVRQPAVSLTSIASMLAPTGKPGEYSSGRLILWVEVIQRLVHRQFAQHDHLCDS
jgi:hypothetical protein